MYTWDFAQLADHLLCGHGEREHIWECGEGIATPMLAGVHHPDKRLEQHKNPGCNFNALQLGWLSIIKLF
jgi:hypothetical protein